MRTAARLVLRRARRARRSRFAHRPLCWARRGGWQVLAPRFRVTGPRSAISALRIAARLVNVARVARGGRASRIGRYATAAGVGGEVYLKRGIAVRVIIHRARRSRLPRNSRARGRRRSRLPRNQGAAARDFLATQAPESADARDFLATRAPPLETSSRLKRPRALPLEISPRPGRRRPLPKN